MNKKAMILLVIGVLLLGLSFVLKHYFTLSDSVDGFIRGLAIGILVVSLLVSRKQRKLKRNSG